MIMKILFIAHEKDLNGASKSLLELIKCLQDNNEIYVLTQYSKGRFVNELDKLSVKKIVLPYYRWIERKNIRLRWILYKIKWMLYANSVNRRTSRIVSDIVLDEKIDVIHTNSSVIDIGVRVHKLNGCPHVMHLREFGDLDFNMIPFLPYNELYDKMNEGTNRFICISKAIENHYSNLYNKKVIYNGVSKDNINFVDKDFTGNINILIAGRISKEKGQDIAIKALDYLFENGNKSINLYLAGSGEIQIPNKLKNNVKLLGYVNDMPRLRKEMHIEIVSSKAEAFGRVTVEAMMGGLIVIGSNAGGTPELISNGENGFLFKCEDFVDLANKIDYCLKNRDALCNISENARKYAIDNFSIERCASEITDLYKSLYLN